jgi:hypothetical protein
MRMFRTALVVLAVLTLSLSFAVPAEDVPETAQDESESLPYETTPLSCALVEESARALSVVPIGRNYSRPAIRHVVVRTELSGQANPGSLTILDHTLRC